MDNFFWLHRLQPAYQQWSAATGGSAIEMHIYSSPETMAQPDDTLLDQIVADTCRAFPELRGHLLHRVLVRNDPTHTLFGVGNMREHLGVSTPWRSLFACGDWVYHPSPALFLERATVTGIAAANAVLKQWNLEPWELQSHPRPEPLAGLIAAILRGARHSFRRSAIF
jgi:isorenieratene synthase